VVGTWALSGKKRNARQHAQNGNVPGSTTTTGWQRVVGGRTLNLREPVEVRRLRECGWKIPVEEAADSMVRVYDTRVEPGWLAAVAAEAGGPAVVGLKQLIIGGDFLTKPYKNDTEALGGRTRWGLDKAVHLLVPPRPHLAVWLQRVQKQVAVEAAGTVVTLVLLLPRWGGDDRTPEEVWRKVPGVEALLGDEGLEIWGTVVGERPQMRRVPSGGPWELPPREWEVERLESEKMMVLLSLRRRQDGGTKQRAIVELIRGDIPRRRPTEAEMLLVALEMPPAMKAEVGTRKLRAAIRKLMQDTESGDFTGAELRQMRVQSGGLLTAVVTVPSAKALQWMQFSGRDGLYIRPLWTAVTGEALRRDRFRLLWARGKREEGPKIWERLRGVKGIVGLTVEGNDVAVRVGIEAAWDMVTPAIDLALHGSGVLLRSAVPGAKWWRLGPLSDVEMGGAKGKLAEMGLVVVGEVRWGKMGPFRGCVYALATGDPVTRTVGDEGWDSSSAKLTEVGPPPGDKHAGRQFNPKGEASAAGPKHPVQAAGQGRRELATISTKTSIAERRGGQLPLEALWGGPRLRAAEGVQPSVPRSHAMDVDAEPQQPEEEAQQEQPNQAMFKAEMEAMLAVAMQEMREENMAFRRKYEEDHAGLQRQVVEGMAGLQQAQVDTAGMIKEIKEENATTKRMVTEALQKAQQQTKADMQEFLESLRRDLMEPRKPSEEPKAGGRRQTTFFGVEGQEQQKKRKEPAPGRGGPKSQAVEAAEEEDPPNGVD